MGMSYPVVLMQLEALFGIGMSCQIQLAEIIFVNGASYQQSIRILIRLQYRNLIGRELGLRFCCLRLHGKRRMFQYVFKSIKDPPQSCIQIFIDIYELFRIPGIPGMNLSLAPLSPEPDRMMEHRRQISGSTETNGKCQNHTQ